MNVEELGTYLEHQGLSDDEIDAVLEHYGVKGQKWGIRRNRTQKRIPSKTERKRQQFDAVKRDTKTQRRVATGAAFIAANIIANGVAKKAGLNKKFVYSTVVLGTASVNSLMRVHGATRLAEIQG